MSTRRDVLVALLSATTALAAAATVRSQPPVMGSRVFDWDSLAARPTGVGSVRSVVQAPTATLDELEMHVTTLRPGVTSHPPHRHPDEELLVIKEGTVEALVNGERRIVGPGSIIFQAADQEHTIRNAGTVPATYHVIKWNSPGMLAKRPR